MSDTDSWVADGGMDAEPVTVETPAAPTVESWAEAPVESAPVEVVEAVVEAAEAAPTEEAAAEIVQNFIDAQHGDETFQIPA